jgi:pyruvate kinase
VRTAHKVQASLIVVLTRGGATARLVAKYRPLVPVLTVAVPVLTTDSLTWTCSNEAPARQCLVTRGLLPLLAEGSARATDSDTTDEILAAAIEHAKRRAALGRDVLYVCFNRALADDLAARISEPGLRIVNFHKLCVDAALAAGIRPTWHEKADAPTEYFSEELPNALADAATAAGGLFDDIVIDEAQDLTDAYFTALNFTLRDASTAHVWIFRDDNQKVFGDAFRVPDEFLPFDLATNVRNTQAIHEAVMALYEGELEPVWAGPPGRPVEVITSSDVGKTVGEVIEGLRTKGDVEANDIVVLSSHPLKSSGLRQVEYDDFVFVTKAWGGRDTEDDDRDHIRFESIKAFKGLEAPVVVLCELEDVAEGGDREREAYVGLSRARAHCVVVSGGTR